MLKHKHEFYITINDTIECLDTECDFKIPKDRLWEFFELGLDYAQQKDSITTSTLTNTKFESELLEAVEKALAGIMVKPEWVLGFIKPVIERNIQNTQPDVFITCLKCGVYHSIYMQCPNQEITTPQWRKDDDLITDDYQSISAWCPNGCGKTMQVVRPGKFQCSVCG